MRQIDARRLGLDKAAGNMPASVGRFLVVVGRFVGVVVIVGGACVLLVMSGRSMY